jgi:hypothetical protein
MRHGEFTNTGAGADCEMTGRPVYAVKLIQTVEFGTLTA